MFLRRPLSIWLLTSVVAVVVAGGLAALAARRNGYDIQPLQQRESLTRPDRGARNLSLQPEAARLSRRLGQRFIRSDSNVTVLIGEVTTGGTRVPVRVVRTQDQRGESVEIGANGRTLVWSAAAGPQGNEAITEFDRSLVERLVFDSADAFVLAQLRGASYQVIGKNVRADLGGADNYDGPLWTVVRVSYAGANSDAKPKSAARVFYINSRTGLIDKVISEIDGEEIEAILDGWTTVKGESFPSVIRWSTAGHQLMEFKVINFERSSVR